MCSDSRCFLLTVQFENSEQAAIYISNVMFLKLVRMHMLKSILLSIYVAILILLQRTWPLIFGIHYICHVFYRSTLPFF